MGIRALQDCKAQQVRLEPMAIEGQMATLAHRVNLDDRDLLAKMANIAPVLRVHVHLEDIENFKTDFLRFAIFLTLQ